MFTADFLQASEKRKPIFDAILKVGEYRQANQQMLSLEKHGKAEVEKLEAAIAQYEESFARMAAFAAPSEHCSAKKLLPTKPVYSSCKLS